MSKLITTEELKKLAADYGIEPAALKAVLIVEADNSGFDAHTGKIKIQFEPGHFKRAKIVNGVEVQSKEWIAYEQAYAIAPEEAMLATSWGLGQIMGFNHKLAGYDKVLAMVTEFKISEYYQLKGMLRFVGSQKTMLGALQRKDWATFAKLYNGKDYKKFDYDNRLASAYEKAKKYV